MLFRGGFEKGRTLGFRGAVADLCLKTVRLMIVPLLRQYRQPGSEKGVREVALFGGRRVLEGIAAVGLANVDLQRNSNIVRIWVSVPFLRLGGLLELLGQ